MGSRHCISSHFVVTSKNNFSYLKYENAPPLQGEFQELFFSAYCCLCALGLVFALVAGNLLSAMIEKNNSIPLENLLKQISQCDLCASELPHGARPVLRAGGRSRILIIGQAPGRRVHESGVPWDDPSGDRLRE